MRKAPGFKKSDDQQPGTTAGNSGQRRQRRYQITSRVTFKWVAPDGATGEGNGISRDVSERGAFVFARKLPPVGTQVSLTIRLQGAATNGRLLLLEMNGEVVRGEVHWRRHLPCGFAVSGKTRVLRAAPEVFGPQPVIH
jgi:PilZ domain